MPDVDVAVLKRRIGRVGVWASALGGETAAVERAAAAEIENLGYGALWVGEAAGSKEALAHSAILLGATRQMMIATGIASIWSRDGVAASNGANALAEAFDGRFVLGLGVSHEFLVTARGHDYSRPLTAMRAFLDTMDAAPYHSPLPEPAPCVLAALRPRMLELAAQRTQGAHPYFTPPEHTARARAILGPEPLLAPEQTVLLNTDPARARQTARAFMARYLAAPNYVNNLKELGWDDRDIAGGGSDALVDAIVAWGDTETIAERVRAHHDAGADHVCVQPLTGTTGELLDHLRALAPVLVGSP
jgi:probable F420-dependent oxidoreductase